MKHRSFFHRISALLLLLTLTFLSPQANADSSEKPAPAKRLTVTATQDKSAPSVQVPLEELDPGNKASLTYVGLTDVCIETSQGKKSLETGIQDGDISVEEIFAYARLDARNGFCTEHKNSIHGLTHFIYVYPGYKLYAAYDLYETPDGKQHLVNELVFAAKSSNLTFSYEDLDQEDWGLTFEVSQADAHSVTLTCTQKGGQQAGKLVLEGYHIFDENYAELETKKTITDVKDFLSAVSLPMNGSDSFTIRWEDLYGTLPKGTYRMDLHIQDDYEKSQLHPLQEKFHDNQRYWVSFDIK